jgi:SAM-dependent methyltransferase
MEQADHTTEAHWDAVYAGRAETTLSWYQRSPVVSLELIESLGLPAEAAVLDVGAGSSSLVDALLARGFSDVSVLDISAAALEVARARLGADVAGRVHWLSADLLDWTPPRAYALWHDRALFHFLVAEADRRRYLEVLRVAVPAGGHAILGTFGEDGPERCSGLPVVRYSAEALAAALGDDFVVRTTRREEHRTPAGVVQPFSWVAATRPPLPQP